MATCLQVRAFLESLSKGGAICLENVETPTEDEWKQICQALQTIDKSTKSSCFKLINSTPPASSAWSSLFRALASSNVFYGWYFNLGEFDDEAAECLGKAFSESDCACTLVLSNSSLSMTARTMIAHRALGKKEIDWLKVCPGDSFITDEFLDACVKLRWKFPRCVLGDPPRSRELDALLAKKVITNLPVQVEIRKRQRELLMQSMSGNTVPAERVGDALKDLAKAEHDRLEKELPRVLDMYALMGGSEFLEMLPKSYDKSDDSENAPVKQWAPCPTDALSMENQLRMLLAMSAYKQAKLKNLMVGVRDEINKLGRGRPLEKFMALRGLADKEALLPGWRLSKSPYSTIPSGNYEYAGSVYGYPYFSSEGSKTMYLYRSQTGRWSFGPSIGFFIWRNKENADSPQCGSWDPDGIIEPGTSKRSLQRGILDFLESRACDPDCKSKLNVSDGLCDLRFGPLKDATRAAEKCCEHGTAFLFDMNRCTFIVDSFTIMVLVYLLIEQTVSKAGGEITRFSNYHIKDDSKPHDEKLGIILNSRCTRPPCLHLNIRVDGWISEVMVMLSNILEVKHEMHYYYELQRSTGVEELWRPVFPPEEDIPTDDVKHEAKASKGHLQVGDVVVFGKKKQHRGTVRFIGQTKFDKTGVWIGLELVDPVGKNDGSVNGETYFECPSKHGVFVRPDYLVKEDAGIVSEDKEMEVYRKSLKARSRKELVDELVEIRRQRLQKRATIILTETE